MQALATIVGKAVVILLKLVGRKGSALPGLVVEKLYPGYLFKGLDQLPMGVVIVTGTNGKTTTTKIIAEVLGRQGLRVLSNPTGSNFVRGTISTIVAKAKFSGKLPYDIAVFEQDEAHAVHFVKFCRPTGVVALNVMRDQLDRFGEIDSTAKLIGQVVEAARKWVVLNANDHRIAGLAGQAKPAKTIWFGHSEALTANYLDDDQLHSAGQPEFFQAGQPEVTLQAINPDQLVLTIGSEQLKLKSQLTGPQNAINAAAAVAACLAVNPSFDPSRLISALETVKPAFGRGEMVNLPTGGRLRLQLVKNPAGFRHSLQLLNKHDYDAVGIAINDDYADGRDVSWLWDVDFTSLRNDGVKVFCGGTRAWDMAVRLKYDEVKTSQAVRGLEQFLDALIDANKSKETVVFCTYTAMLKLRKLLKRHDRELVKAGV